MTTQAFVILIVLILCGCTTDKSTSNEANTIVITPSEVNKVNVLVTVNFEDEEIGKIITETAWLYDLTVVIPRIPEMKKKITYKAENVSWKTIFKQTLDQVNYGYVVEEKIVKIKVEKIILKTK